MPETPPSTDGPPAAGRQPVAAALSSRTFAGGWPLLLVALGACWLLFFHALSGDWRINPQYNYGYVVPFLGLVLFWRRWPGRPPAQPPASPGLTAGVGAALLALLLPLRVVLEANPEWRLLYWVQGAQMAALTLCLVHGVGGWPWVRYFAAPVGFMLIAIPWPMEVETWIVQGLMRLVAGLTVAVADWISPPAVQHGNLIEVGPGVVGIDEACSGVRSLQSALMLSLFLGEMHRLSFRRRFGLLCLSLVCVLAANLTRTTFLVWTANHRGMQAMEARHDLAGILVMLIVLPGILGLARLLKPSMKEPASGARAMPPAVPRAPVWVGLGALAWLGTALIATEAWYRLHEGNRLPNARWSVAWPVEEPHFRKMALPENALALLRCFNSESASWQDADGNEWSAFFLRWAPGKNSAQLAKGHRPDICFPAAGARLVEDFGQTSITANGIDIPFRHQSFERGLGLAHAFYCLWPDRIAPSQGPLLEDGSRASRWEAVRAGKRHLGQQVLEITLQGPDSGDQALACLRTELPRLIRRD